MERKKQWIAIRLLLKKAWKRQFFSIFVLFFLIFASALSLFLAITLYTSGRKTITKEMERLGFGDITIWTRNESETLVETIRELPEVEHVMSQKLLYAGYEVNGYYSDNEGQLIIATSNVPYHFIDRNGKIVKTPKIEQGMIYVSPAMQSMFDVQIGDTITFELSRTKGKKSLTIAGYFADAFMGSTMIDMKSFLINKEDYREMLAIIDSAEKGDVLGKSGSMLHITRKKQSSINNIEFFEHLQEETNLAYNTEFSYYKESIAGYMLLLQNMLSGFLLIFALVFFLICLIMTRHTFLLIMEQEKKDMASLKTIGFSGRTIRLVYLLLYGGSILFGLFLGIVCCKPVAILIERNMVSSTGFLIEVKIPWKEVLILFGIYSILFLFFLFLYTTAILKTAPMETLQMKGQIQKSNSCICKKLLIFSIAVRSVLSEKPKYISLCFIAISLTIFLSIFGRMGTWLGIHGEGLMNAFSVADHDIGVQPLNHSVPMDEIERAINWYSPIVETYELAMQPVIVNGKEYTANVLNDITWFHILKGSVCDGDSILITDTIAKELSLEIGDSVKVSANGRVEEYFISGIYQCANGMGTNIGMSLEGYSKIGDITGFIFCYHYILEDGSMRDYIYEYLEEHYQGIDVHTNRWSGLDDIVFLMHSLLIILYFFAALLIFISVSFISRKLLQSEKGTVAIYRSLGFGVSKLRISFLLRFLLVVLLGTGIGLMIAEVFADTLIGIVFRKFGIGEFVIGISILGTLVPALMLVLFFGFSTWVSSAKLSKIRVIELLSESE